MEYSPVDLGQQLSQFSEAWSPKVVVRLNDYEIKVVKLDGEVRLGPSQLFVVPRGVQHCPVTAGEVQRC